MWIPPTFQKLMTGGKIRWTCFWFWQFDSFCFNWGHVRYSYIEVDTDINRNLTLLFVEVEKLSGWQQGNLLSVHQFGQYHVLLCQCPLCTELDWARLFLHTKWLRRSLLCEASLQHAGLQLANMCRSYPLFHTFSRWPMVEHSPTPPWPHIIPSVGGPW